MKAQNERRFKRRSKERSSLSNSKTKEEKGVFVPVFLEENEGEYTQPAKTAKCEGVIGKKGRKRGWGAGICEQAETEGGKVSADRPRIRKHLPEQLKGGG